jgi:hypothetical protein
LAAERERFRVIWQSAASVADAARALGVTERQARNRATQLRGYGIKLKLLGLRDQDARGRANRKRFVSVWNAAATPEDAAKMLGYGLEFVRSMASRLRRLGWPVKYVRKPPPPHKRAYRPQPNGTGRQRSGGEGVDRSGECAG